MGLEKLLVESGLISAEELATGKSERPADASLTIPGPDAMAAGLSSGRPVDVAPTTPPAFGVGDEVRVRNINPTGHTRAPRYTRGRRGVIALHHGCHVFPDTHTTDTEEGHHLYGVRFSAEELWGGDGGGGFVFVDLWEPYLEPA